MLQVKGLSKSFETHGVVQKALDGISVSFPNRGMVFVVGRSGSGKSTFLNMMAGFSIPDSGDVLFYGKSVTGMSERELDLYHYQDIAFIFQNYCILEELTVEENVALGIQESPKRAFDSVTEVLDRVGLLFQREKKAKYLSGGEKQRVAIARAMLKNPSVIFADEPTGNLDRVSSDSVLSLLKECSKERLVIIVSHNLMDAYGYGDRILTLDQGKVVDDRSLSERKLVYPDVYLSQDTLFDRSGLERLNLEIGKGNVPVFHSKKEAFVKTVDQMDDEVPERSKTKSSFFGPFVSIMKAISSNRLKTVLLSLIISLVLVVFSSTYYLSVFDGLDRGNDSYFRKSDTYVLQKGSLDDINGVSSIRPLYLGYIDEEDEKALSTAFGDKKVYRLYRYGHPYVSTFSKFAQGSNVDFDLDGLDPRAVEDGRGLLVCDEAFIRKNLRISEIGFVKSASALKRSGVYITDYLADSMMSSSPEVYGSYDDLVGPLYPAKETPDNLVPIESIYVNGIIRTDYQKKIPDLLRYAKKGGKDHSYLVYGECQDESDYLLNALTQYYTTDSSFFEDVKKEETRKVDCQYLSLSNGEDIDVSIPMYVVFSPELKDDEVILPSGFIRNYLFDTESHFIQEYNGREDSKKMSLSYGLRVYDERECISESISVKRLRRMEDLSKDARPYLPSPVYSVVVSRDSFYRLLGAVSLPTRYYFDGYSDADGIYSLLKKRNFYEKTLKSELDLTAAYYVSSLSPLLRFCSRFALAASFVSLCSYSVLLVMDNRYRIGVWKAIGYRGKSLSLYFLLCSVFFLFGTAVLYVCSAFVFDRLLNGILSQAVYTTLKCASRPRFVFLSFSVMDFLKGLGVSFLLSALSELVYLFFFRKIRVDRVLRRKE